MILIQSCSLISKFNYSMKPALEINEHGLYRLKKNNYPGTHVDIYEHFMRYRVDSDQSR